MLQTSKAATPATGPHKTRTQLQDRSGPIGKQNSMCSQNWGGVGEAMRPVPRGREAPGGEKTVTPKSIGIVSLNCLAEATGI